MTMAFDIMGMVMGQMMEASVGKLRTVRYSSYIRNLIISKGETDL